jgi:hypothetical protein
MKIFNFSTFSCIETLYSTFEIEERLKDISSIRLGEKRYFSGKVNSSGFKLYPEFDFSHRSLLRPEIIGKMYPKEEKTRIEINFDIPSSTKFSFKLGLYFNIIVFLFILIVISIGFLNFEIFKNTLNLPEFNRNYLFIIPIVHILILFIGIKTTIFTLNIKIESSTKVLTKVLKGKIIN